VLQDSGSSARFCFSVVVNSPSSPMFAEIQSVHFVGICGTAMASVAAAMRDKGFEVTGPIRNVYPPMSTFLADRGIEVMAGFAEANLAGKPDWWSSAMRCRAATPKWKHPGSQAEVLLAAGTDQDLLYSRQTLSGRRGNPWQDDHHRSLDLGFRTQRPQPELPDWRHPDQPFARRAFH